MRAIFYLFYFLFIVSCINNHNNEIINKAREIHERVISIDTHNDIDVKNFKSTYNYSIDTKNQVTLNINSFLKILKQLGEIKETQNF